MLGKRLLPVSYIFMLVPPNPCNVIGWGILPIPLPRTHTNFSQRGKKARILSWIWQFVSQRYRIGSVLSNAGHTAVVDMTAVLYSLCDW